MASQIPNSELFVVHYSPDNKEDLTRRLEKVGSTEDMEQDNMLLVHVKEKKQAAPQAAWERLSAAVGSAGAVQPVLSDERGTPHYPTGEVTVRFVKKPSEKELKAFSSKYGLRLRDRNEFVPEQAAFQVEDPGANYLPDLLKQITSSKTVDSAWANTLSSYKRMK